MPQTDTVIVFIHGAGLSPDIWRRLAPIAGAESSFASFPRRGQAEAAKLTFEEYETALTRQIQGLRHPRIVLVGHSLGGTLMMRMSEVLGDRVVGLVAMAAMIPLPNEDFFSCLPFPQRTILPLVVRLAGTKVPESAIRRGLCADLSGEQADAVVKGFTAESRRLYCEPIRYTPRELPALYVVFSGDQDFPPARQRLMARRLHADVEEVPGGHLAMLSQPETLGRLLAAFTARL